MFEKAKNRKQDEDTKGKYKDISQGICIKIQ